MKTCMYYDFAVGVTICYKFDKGTHNIDAIQSMYVTNNMQNTHYII